MNYLLSRRIYLSSNLIISIFHSLFGPFYVSHVWVLSKYLKINTVVHILLMPVTSSIEQVICRIGNNTIHLITSNLGDSAVIEFIPFAIDWILSIGCVVTEAHVTIVIGYCIAVVYELFLVATILIYISKNMFAHVKTIKWEINLQVDLLIVAHTSHHAEVSTTISTLRSASLESLKTDDQDWRCSVDLKLLGGLDVFFTFIAVPKVILVENLWLRKFNKAVIDGDLFLLVVLVLTILLIDSLTFFNSGKMLY